MRFSQGDIILIEFPFTDQINSKTRPAIVISNSSVNKTSDILLAAITSIPNDDEFTFRLASKMITHKELHGEIRCHKIFLAEKARVKKKISQLKEPYLSEMINKVISVIKKEKSSP